MPLAQPTPVVSPLLQLRATVAFLGEKPQAGWWDTSFLHPLVLQYLGLIYPKTTHAAALTAASKAANAHMCKRLVWRALTCACGGLSTSIGSSGFNAADTSYRAQN
jgi:hypothetical protein